MPLLLLYLGVLCFAGVTGFAAEQKTRPNILFCIADDWSYPHAGVLGDKVVRTPNIDRLGKEGIVFTNAFCAAPSCTPSRAAILTGRYPHELEQGGNLWSFLPVKFQVYPDLLEQGGYFVGHTRKGWSPGNFKLGGRERNPAGPHFKNFGEFLERRPEDAPFCFWFGSVDPHRPYDRGSGARAGLKAGELEVPPWWPDKPEVRDDILDYYHEIERFDREVGELLALLQAQGLLENTVVVITSDNGMPFPRAKANVYDAGSHVPLIFWGGEWTARRSGAFVNLLQIAPTMVELAGLPVPDDMSLPSLVPLLQGNEKEAARKVFVERERHANVRAGNLSYPMRAIRTADFLYIQNLRPERWPAGDPENYFSVGAYGDVDNSPTKTAVLQLEGKKEGAELYEIGFAKRPGEELYDLANDPRQLRNVAGEKAYESARRELAGELQRWMQQTEDPRTDPENDPWSEYIYVGPPGKR